MILIVYYKQTDKPSIKTPPIKSKQSNRNPIQKKVLLVNRDKIHMLTLILRYLYLVTHYESKITSKIITDHFYIKHAIDNHGLSGSGLPPHIKVFG